MICYFKYFFVKLDLFLFYKMHRVKWNIIFNYRKFNFSAKLQKYFFCLEFFNRFTLLLECSIFEQWNWYTRKSLSLRIKLNFTWMSPRISLLVPTCLNSRHLQVPKSRFPLVSGFLLDLILWLQSKDLRKIKSKFLRDRVITLET